MNDVPSNRAPKIVLRSTSTAQLSKPESFGPSKTNADTPAASLTALLAEAAAAKSDLRQVFKRAITLYNSNSGAVRSIGHLCFNLETFFSKIGALGTWAAFQPAGSECNIRPALARMDSIDWVYPRVEGESMRFYRAAPGSLIENQWGILEPDPACSQPVELGSLQGLIIPALAFDSKCNRLGRGGGFYDRVLAELKLINPNACKIGVALDIQISAEKFPTESFDVPMDWVVTESRSFERTY